MAVDITDEWTTRPTYWQDLMDKIFITHFSSNNEIYFPIPAYVFGITVIQGFNKEQGVFIYHYQINSNGRWSVEF